MWHRYKAIKWFEVVSVKYYASDFQKTSTLIFVQETKARLRRKISNEFQVHLKLSQTAAVLNWARKQSLFVIYLFFSYIGMLLLTIKKKFKAQT